MKNLLSLILFLLTLSLSAQKAISPNLFGIFIEDLNYTADGGLYPELIQNRSFEYSPSDMDVNKQPRGGWHSFTAWEFAKENQAIATLSVETSQPIHENNPHYMVIDVKTVGKYGAGIRNTGFDGIPVKKGTKYTFSIWARNIDNDATPIAIALKNPKGINLVDTTLTIDSKQWKKYAFTVSPSEDADSCTFKVLSRKKGRIAVDEISLYPQDTYKGHGLRRDLVQALADLHPGFVRFPGGCLSHGDGIDNIYRWKYTIGPVEQRHHLPNIWNYHQSMGLGYFEYLQLCEDIGAEPLPVMAAGVSCQNSARRSGDGQEAIPMEEMDEYIQDILDFIEYCNGSATSTWGQLRAQAGHPAPFNLKYIGIGNEDHITHNFEVRFKMIQKALNERYPDIKIVGTAGPGQDGKDFDEGWRIARAEKVPIVDEHYYCGWGWFIKNLHRYDNYPRDDYGKVYVGEYASWGNEFSNALAEAAYMTQLERNGDVVEFASYAPLLARIGHTQWNPDLIYFDGTGVYPTVNYQTQKLFANNRGDIYYDNIITKDGTYFDRSSCVKDSKSGDIILKMVNMEDSVQTLSINLSTIKGLKRNAVITTLQGDPKAKNTKESPSTVLPESKPMKIGKQFKYSMPANSLTIIRIK